MTFARCQRGDPIGMKIDGNASLRRDLWSMIGPRPDPVACHTLPARHMTQRAVPLRARGAVETLQPLHQGRETGRVLGELSHAELWRRARKNWWWF